MLGQEKFSTFARTLSPYKLLAPMIYEMMRLYDWTRVMLVESSHHVWQVTSGDIQVRADPMLRASVHAYTQQLLPSPTPPAAWLKQSY